MMLGILFLILAQCICSFGQQTATFDGTTTENQYNIGSQTVTITITGLASEISVTLNAATITAERLPYGYTQVPNYIFEITVGNGQTFSSDAFTLFLTSADLDSTNTKALCLWTDTTKQILSWQNHDTQLTPPDNEFRFTALDHTKETICGFFTVDPAVAQTRSVHSLSADTPTTVTHSMLTVTVQSVATPQVAVVSYYVASDEQQLSVANGGTASIRGVPLPNNPFHYVYGNSFVDVEFPEKLGTATASVQWQVGNFPTAPTTTVAVGTLTQDWNSDPFYLLSEGTVTQQGTLQSTFSGSSFNGRYGTRYALFFEVATTETVARTEEAVVGDNVTFPVAGGETSLNLETSSNSYIQVSSSDTADISVFYGPVSVPDAALLPNGWTHHFDIFSLTMTASTSITISSGAVFRILNSITDAEKIVNATDRLPQQDASQPRQYSVFWFASDLVSAPVQVASTTVRRSSEDAVAFDITQGVGFYGLASRAYPYATLSSPRQMSCASDTCETQLVALGTEIPFELSTNDGVVLQPSGTGDVFYRVVNEVAAQGPPPLGIRGYRLIPGHFYQVSSENALMFTQQLIAKYGNIISTLIQPFSQAIEAEAAIRWAFWNSAENIYTIVNNPAEPDNNNAITSRGISLDSGAQWGLFFEAPESSRTVTATSTRSPTGTTTSTTSGTGTSSGTSTSSLTNTTTSSPTLTEIPTHSSTPSTTQSTTATSVPTYTPSSTATATSTATTRATSTPTATGTHTPTPIMTDDGGGGGGGGGGGRGITNTSTPTVTVVPTHSATSTTTPTMTLTLCQNLLHASPNNCQDPPSTPPTPAPSTPAPPSAPSFVSPSSPSIQPGECPLDCQELFVAFDSKTLAVDFWPTPEALTLRTVVNANGDCNEDPVYVWRTLNNSPNLNAVVEGSTTSRELRLRPNALQNGVSHRFEFEATHCGANRVVSHSITGNAPPSSTANPNFDVARQDGQSGGITALTPVTLSAIGWADSDGPLEYEYSYLDPVSSTKRYLAGPTTNPVMEVIPPAVQTTQDIDFQVEITDPRGVFTTATDRVNVQPPAWQSGAEVEEAVNTRLNGLTSNSNAQLRSAQLSEAALLLSSAGDGLVSPSDDDQLRQSISQAILNTNVPSDSTQTAQATRSLLSYAALSTSSSSAVVSNIVGSRLFDTIQKFTNIDSRLFRGDTADNILKVVGNLLRGNLNSITARKMRTLQTTSGVASSVSALMEQIYQTVPAISQNIQLGGDPVIKQEGNMRTKVYRFEAHGIPSREVQLDSQFTVTFRADIIGATPTDYVDVVVIEFIQTDPYSNSYSNYPRLLSKVFTISARKPNGAPYANFFPDVDSVTITMDHSAPAAAHAAYLNIFERGIWNQAATHSATNSGQLTDSLNRLGIFAIVEQQQSSSSPSSTIVNPVGGQQVCDDDAPFWAIGLIVLFSILFGLTLAVLAVKMLIVDVGKDAAAMKTVRYNPSHDAAFYVGADQYTAQQGVAIQPSSAAPAPQ